MNAIKTTLQSERRAEQQADRKERQKELHTPTPRRSTVLDYSKELPPDEWMKDILEQAGEAIAACEKGQKK
jgi:hypothetical protein